MDLTIAQFTGMQNQHDYYASPLPNSTAQCELVDMSHNHEMSISRFALWFGVVQGQLVLRCLQGPWKPRKPSTAPDSIWSPVYYTEEYVCMYVCMYNYSNS
jgi:hypothetical protein